MSFEISIANLNCISKYSMLMILNVLLKTNFKPTGNGDISLNAQFEKRNKSRLQNAL